MSNPRLTGLTALATGLVLAAGMLMSLAGVASDAEAGTIVVANDEWTLSNTGFSNAADTGVYVANLVAEFGPLIHAYSTNFGFTQSSLATAMTTAGATYTTGTGITFDLPTLSTYDAILLGGDYLTATQIDVLEDYVAAGGSVYIAAGTGVGGPANEAAAWNGFLANFGLSLASSYNGIAGNIAVSGDPIFNGVSALYQNNGNSISGSHVVCCGNNGLYAVVRVPEPVSLCLFAAGLAGLGMLRRRSR